jgi:hypothetical protein
MLEKFTLLEVHMNKGNRSRNAIFGSISNLNIEQIRPFLVSPKQSGFDGDLYLFIDKTSDNTIDNILKYNWVRCPPRSHGGYPKNRYQHMNIDINI